MYELSANGKFHRIELFNGEEVKLTTIDTEDVSGNCMLLFESNDYLSDDLEVI